MTKCYESGLNDGGRSLLINVIGEVCNDCAALSFIFQLLEATVSTTSDSAGTYDSGDSMNVKERALVPALTRIVLVAGFGVLAGCATASRSATTYKPPETRQGIVIVVNGGGGLLGTSDAIVAEVKKSQLPLFVRTFDWSHGLGQIVADMTDEEHAQCEARGLADLVKAYRDRFPNTPIYIVAHSAGTYITLEATKSLPPDSLERIVLLAPAVSADYDVGPALAVAKNVDCFYSRRDGIFLGLGTGVLGTADGERGVPPAGRVGFDPPALSIDQAPLSARLHQHAWEPSVGWTGNNGSHDGALRPKYLRAYVLPPLSPERSGS